MKGTKELQNSVITLGWSTQQHNSISFRTYPLGWEIDYRVSGFLVMLRVIIIAIQITFPWTKQRSIFAQAKEQQVSWDIVNSYLFVVWLTLGIFSTIGDL